MIKDLGPWAWRVGIVLIIAMPLLYVASALTMFAPNQGGSIGQFIAAVQMTVPAIFLSMAIGLALCLLVRIERHLRPTGEDA